MVLFHLFLDPATGAFAYVILTLNVLLMVWYRKSYRALFVAKAATSLACLMRRQHASLILVYSAAQMSYT